MECPRCKKSFPESSLRPLSKLLTILSFPVFVFLMVRSAVVRQEMRAGYCSPCRRQLNMCLFFGAFLIFACCLGYVLDKLGLMGNP